MARRVAGVLVVVALACGNKQDFDPPAPYSEPPKENLMGCSELRTATTTLREATILVDGQPAVCAAPGLHCPLAGVLAFPRCEVSELPYAYCPPTEEWVVECEPTPPPGAGGQLFTGGAGGEAPSIPSAGGTAN